MEKKPTLQAVGKKTVTQSKTERAGVIAAIATITGIFGVNVTDSEIEQIVKGVVAVASILFIMYDRYKKGDLAMTSKGLKIVIASLIASAMLSATTACSPVLSSTVADADKATTGGTPGSVSRMDNDGNQTASYQGPAPSLLKQDVEGSWMNTQGQGGLVSWILPGEGGQAYVWSPKDGKIAKLSYTPRPREGEATLVVEGLEFNLSPVITAYTEQFALAMQALQTMTQEEARVKIQQLQTAGDISASVADVLLQTVVPHLPATPQ